MIQVSTGANFDTSSENIDRVLLTSFAFDSNVEGKHCSRYFDPLF